jgi:heptosyltransferase II
MNNPKTFKNILIVRTDRIGDVVLTTPAIKAIRRSYPVSHIAVLVTPATYDLVNGNPYVDEILVDERQGRHKNLFGFLRLVREIGYKKFDLAIIFHTKRRYNLACYAAGIPCRLGYKNNKFGFLLTHPLKDVRPQGKKHEAQYCLEVLKAIGIEANDLDVFVPMQKEAEVWVSQWMQENSLRSNEFIVIHAGASDITRYRCWPPENFARLMDRLAERYAWKIVLIGSAQSISSAQEILRQTHRQSQFLNLTGKTSLMQMVSLLRRARLLISNDSGPVHVAAGVGTYVIALFLRNQPGVNAERWKPLGAKGFILGKSPTSFSVENVLELTEKIFQKNNQYEIF